MSGLFIGTNTTSGCANEFGTDSTASLLGEKAVLSNGFVLAPFFFLFFKTGQTLTITDNSQKPQRHGKKMRRDGIFEILGTGKLAIFQTKTRNAQLR